MSEQEGVIRFQIEHVLGEVPAHADMEALIQLRDELHACGLIGVNEQGVGYGNVSLRKSGRETGQGQNENLSFIISGTGTGGLPRLDVDGYCLVSDCDPAQNKVRCCGPVAASSESMTHWAAYAADPRIDCVIHVHSQILFDTLLRRKTPATPRGAAYGTPAMAAAVGELVASMPPAGLVVMAGHDEGVLAFAPDIASARSILIAALQGMASCCFGRPAELCITPG